MPQPEIQHFQCSVSELAESDSELNEADREDNITLDSIGSDDSASLGGDQDKGHGDDDFVLNSSFTGGYVPNTDISRVDKGKGNPQFADIDIKV